MTTRIGYARVSTREQGDSGLGLDAQKEIITAYCQRRGDDLATIVTDVASAKIADGRTGLTKALAACTAGVVDGLVVAKLDRLARSTLDFASILGRAKTEGWTLVVVDIGLDLSTPAGTMVASIMASIAQWEREIIGMRTRDALTEARRRGKALGRPSGLDDATIARIIRERDEGASHWQIARDLNRDGIPGGHGGRWQPATVRYVINRYGSVGESPQELAAP